MFAFYHDYNLIQSLTRTDGLRTPSSRVISMHLYKVEKRILYYFPDIPLHSNRAQNYCFFLTCTNVHC